MGFIGCALLLAGLPPLSGFLAKFAMLAPLFGSGDGVPATAWALLAALILSGLATVVAMTRAGIDAFWASPAGEVPRVRRDRDRPGRAAAGPVPGADRPGRAGHALHGGHRSVAACAAGLRPGVLPAPPAPEQVERGGP